MKQAGGQSESRATPNGIINYDNHIELRIITHETTGIPAVTYVRIVNQESGGISSSDIISDASSVTILEPNKPSTRHESASFVLPRGITDQETCECTIGQDAGGSHGTGGRHDLCIS